MHLFVEALESRRLFASVPAGFIDETLITGLANPTAMEQAPDGRIFVAQQGGSLRVVKNGVLLPTPFASVTVDPQGERGLLGVTLDPDFANNGFVYIYYTATSPNLHNRVSRFTAAGDVAVPGSEVVLLDLNPLTTATNHNGGALHFGADGKLYVAVGENATPSNSQTLNNLLGKVLRINPDGSIPTDNPFFTTAAGQNRAIWALGLRNPFTFAFQPGTGRMFINDVGSSAFEEINDGLAGANYGWPATEGPTSNPSFTAPIHAYGRNVGQAITGGAFYNPANNSFPADFTGDYFFADAVAGFIRRLEPGSGNAVSPFATDVAVPVDLDVDAGGNLLYLERGFGVTSGRIGVVRFDQTAPPSITQQPASVAVREGTAVNLSLVASGPGTLGFQWQKDGVDLAGATTSTFTIPAAAQADAGAYRVIVTNAFGSTPSDAAAVTITVNQAPVPVIVSPHASARYFGGKRFAFAGRAIDSDDGLLAASAFTWRVDFHHADHTHPFVPTTTGVRQVRFTIPNTGETATDVFYRVILSATDSEGATTETFRDITPRLVTVTMLSNIPGASFTLDGQPQPELTTFTTVAGIRREIGVIPPPDSAGQTFAFRGWSAGNPNATRTIAPPTNRFARMIFVASPVASITSALDDEEEA